MNTGFVLLLLGGFLLGGAWSVWRTDEEHPDRGGPQVAMAFVLLLAAVIASAAGILRLV